MWLDDLPDEAIDSTDRMPLHAQLSALLRDRVDDGTLPAGTLLPSEAELQRRFGISRSVVRQALLALTSEGLIERGRGRGSVVAPRAEHHRFVQRISGLSTQLSAVTTAVLRLGPDDDAHAREALGVGPIIGLLRLRSAQREPIAVIETWLPEEIVPGLTADVLTDASLHGVLRERFGVSVVAGRRQVRGVAASEVMADRLGIETGSPLLLLEGTSVDESGAAVEVFRTWHRADRVVFDIDVLPGSDARTAVFEVDPIRTGSDAAGTEWGRDAGALAARFRSLARELAEISEELGRL